jgi:two-component system, chemotaxis family, sensor kinase CheA
MGGLAKYRGLIIAITLFLLVVAGVTTVNLFIAKDLNQDAIGVNLAGRQRMLSQRTAKTIFQTQAALNNATDASGAQKELAGAVNLFDQTLTAFQTGAEVIGGSGKPVFLAKAKVGQDKITAASQIWAQYQAVLAPLVNVKGEVTGTPNTEQMAAIARFAAENNTKILTLMNELTTALETQATARAARLRLIQIVALSTALLLFSYIVFFSLRNLRRADAEVVAAKQETDNILNTVNDGLFLIDRNITIGTQQSKSLEQIFGMKNIAGRGLLEVLSKLVPEKTLQTAKTFVDLLFGERVKEALMADVNPLKEVEINTVDEQGKRDIKYLAFQFRRVLTGQKLTHLLVSAADITPEVELRRELDLTRKRNEEQVTLLTKMMHLSGAELGSFMDKTQAGLDDMNAVLASSGTSRSENISKIGRLFRIVHTIKGDAAALDFDPIESWAHRFESQIHALTKLETVSGAELLPLTVALREMYQQITGIRELVGKLGEVRATLDDSQSTRTPLEGGIATRESAKPRISVWAKAQLLAPKVAEREGKQVKLDIRKDPGVVISNAQFHGVSDSLVQLVRNAIVHGIESPERRIAMGKSAQGSVRIHLAHGSPGQIEVNVEDDGAGINLDTVRAHAVQNGLLDAATAASASPKEVIRLLFTGGFSTATRVTEDAGRGVGLDVIEKAVQGMNGRLAMGVKLGRGTRFSIVLPCDDANESEPAAELAA